MANLDIKIEAILFFRGEPVSVEDLSRLLKIDKSEIRDALDTLEIRLKGGGVNLLRNDDKVTLGTAPETGYTITS